MKIPSIWHDAEAYVTALVSQGRSGVVVPKRGFSGEVDQYHLVLWDPRVLRGVAEVSYDEDS